jgi:hypothetical protein
MSLHGTSMSLDPTAIEPDLEREARRLLSAIEREGVDARLIGGMAILLLAGPRMHPRYTREIQDLDFVITKKHRRGTEQLLTAAGYVPEAQFNALNGARRLLFHDETHGRQIDVFVDRFEMCHVLPLTERLTRMPDTLPAAEVLMTKLQIVELNAKDADDARALLLEHELGTGHGDHVDVQYLGSLVAADWGLWRTVTGTLRQLAALRHEVAEPALALVSAFDEVPKTRGWRMRARIGERKRWYELPDEVG